MAEQWQTITGFTEVGFTRKAHGKDGELFLVINKPFLRRVLGSAFLFLNLDGNMVPFRIEGFRDAADLLIKFEGIDDPGAANALASKVVCVPADEMAIPQKDSQHQEYVLLEGYRVVDRAAGEIGQILSIEQYPQQEMASVLYKGSAILIPLVSEFIDEIDTEKQILFTILPEGFLEI